MSVAELGARARAGRERSLAGWGRVAPSRAQVIRPLDAGEIGAVLARVAAAGTGVIARGAGRSYGDAAQSGWGQLGQKNHGAVGVDKKFDPIPGL